MAAWRNGIASDYDLSCNQEIAGSSPAVVISFSPSIFTTPRTRRQDSNAFVWTLPPQLGLDFSSYHFAFAFSTTGFTGQTKQQLEIQKCLNVVDPRLLKVSSSKESGPPHQAMRNRLLFRRRMTNVNKLLYVL